MYLKNAYSEIFTSNLHFWLPAAQDHCLALLFCAVMKWIAKRKGKEADLYSAYRQYNSTAKRSDVDHTELPANTPHLPFLRINIR